VAKNADRKKYMDQTVNPAVQKARADMISMGDRGSFGQLGLESMLAQGNQEADAFGEEAASRSFGNLVNLRNQYLSAQDRAQSNQGQMFSQLGSMAGGPSSGSAPGARSSVSDGFKSSIGNMTKGGALMGALQGVTNFAAQNPYIQQGYKSGGLFGAAAAVPRAAGKILFGI